MDKQFFVYIMSNRPNGTLYIGVTSNLLQRVAQHRQGVFEGFTKKYDAKMLVYYEQHTCAESAITREKAMKKWLRGWKVKTILAFNPDWKDLALDLGFKDGLPPSRE